MPASNEKVGRIQVEKSIYDPRSKSDGRRILVMRMWPRGIEKSKVDKWLKELGTEKELIKKWKSGGITLDAFKSRYVSDIEKSKEAETAIESILDLLGQGETVTLLCVERDPSQCHRSFLKQIIENRRGN